MNDSKSENLEVFSWKTIPMADCPLESFHAILENWHDLRGTRFAPAWQDMDLQTFEYKSITHICVIDVLDGPPFKYRFFGTALAILHNLELTSKTTAEIMPLAYRKLCEDQYARVIESRTPVLFVGSVKSEQGLELKHYNLRLPLSDDGETITNILTTENYDEIPDELKKVYRDSDI